MTLESFLSPFALALLLSGCDGDDYQPQPIQVPPGAPLAECPDADYATCDVRERACQTRLLSLAACLRGNDPLTKLRIDVLSETDYAAYLRDDGSSSPQDGVLHFNRALSRFGLAPFDRVPDEQQISETVDFVAGQYSSDEKRVIIVDHGRSASSGGTNSVLVHEFIHALQDAAYDLSVWPGVEAADFGYDQSLAARTVIEGEAEFYGERAAAPLFGLDAERVDFEAKFQNALDRKIEKALEGQSLLTQSNRTLSYGMGALQAFHAWQDGGPSGIEPLWQEPPRTMQSIMAKLWGENTPQADGVAIPPPLVPTTLQLYGDSTLGAWGLCLVLTKSHGDSARAADFIHPALTWRGDHFWVYTDAATQKLTYALWQVELESESAARELSDVFAKLPVTQQMSGSRVFVSYNMNEREPDPALTQWGRSWLGSRRD